MIITYHLLIAKENRNITTTQPFWRSLHEHLRTYFTSSVPLVELQDNIEIHCTIKVNKRFCFDVLTLKEQEAYFPYNIVIDVLINEIPENSNFDFVAELYAGVTEFTPAVCEQVQHSYAKAEEATYFPIARHTLNFNHDFYIPVNFYVKYDETELYNLLDNIFRHHKATLTLYGNMFMVTISDHSDISAFVTDLLDILLTKDAKRGLNLLSKHYKQGVCHVKLASSHFIEKQGYFTRVIYVTFEREIFTDFCRRNYKRAKPGFEVFKMQGNSSELLKLAMHSAGCIFFKKFFTQTNHKEVLV